LAALALELGKDKLKDYLGVMISSLQREILVKETGNCVKILFVFKHFFITLY
jgi:hypothetical protein